MGQGYRRKYWLSAHYNDGGFVPHRYLLAEATISSRIILVRTHLHMVIVSA
ncbi:hypothetical protein QNH28_03545 [Paenibacillus sp. G2S3]|uniref:hypothetical protein n=1 Tax=Paenibacillus sp. G2S3 TaxID=3047872 RepID=UPI0024C11ADC|nr:hypothetical protein [Paenibacillus sp. G2S3]WHY20108.1 hypothetical protein QNH28_03545 [Paenibacillus sp. G2S3]